MFNTSFSRMCSTGSWKPWQNTCTTAKLNTPTCEKELPLSGGRKRGKQVSHGIHEQLVGIDINLDGTWCHRVIYVLE